MNFLRKKHVTDIHSTNQSVGQPRAPTSDVGAVSVPITTTQTQQLLLANNDTNGNVLTQVTIVSNDTETQTDTVASSSTLSMTTTELPAAIIELNSSLELALDQNGNVSSSIRCEVDAIVEASAAAAAAATIAPIALVEDAEICDFEVEINEIVRSPTITTAGPPQKLAQTNITSVTATTANGNGNSNGGVPLATSAPSTTVRRSKSRVRTYLKKCKDRLTGQHHHEAPAAPSRTSASASVHDASVQCQLPAIVSLVPSPIAEMEIGNRQTASAIATETLESNRHNFIVHSPLLEAVEEDTEGSYEDIDFQHDIKNHSKGNVESSFESESVELVSAVSSVINDPLEELEDEIEKVHERFPHNELQLARVLQMESGIGALLDSHLARVFPFYFQCARITLMREARDLLVCSYHGCLDTFERRFLRKYTEIALHLKLKHRIGESLTWGQGWPLVTNCGNLVLHLGVLDETLLRPADIYLCVKEANDLSKSAVPQLCAVWRSPPKEATAAQIQSCCIDCFNTDPASSSSSLSSNILVKNSSSISYLSVLALEMLSDDLPQLLQNLLVGVERTIGRISLNELQMPKSETTTTSSTAASTSETTTFVTNVASELIDNASNNNNKDDLSTTTTNMLRSNIVGNNNNNNFTNSPKCALKRSELITKNKILGHKYMLRRMTNRQDSMNSTSSGNSCASSGSSASSVELLMVTEKQTCNNSNNNNNNNNNNERESQSNSSSPALPLFCLGSSFPHIDSDEENQEEKRNSLECDQFGSEIIPPTSITEIPEKLLTSGIYLPGTRDLKGQPIITVDAEVVNMAALNCYEIATVLLYYSTIPESAIEESEFQPKLSTQAINTILELQTDSIIPTVTAIKPAQQTFTLLIAIEQSRDLCVVDLVCQSLKLLKRHIKYCEIFVVCLLTDQHLLELSKNNSTTATSTATTTLKPMAATDKKQLQQQQKEKEQQQNQHLQQQQQEQQQQQQQLQLHQHQNQHQYLVKFISVNEVTTSVATTQIPHGKLRGLHHHDARKWREFFMQLEPFQAQCTSAGQRLVAAMCELRTADLNGLPTRRQLYAQHRALSRALMDSELHNLQKRGITMLTHLEELAKSISYISDCNTVTVTSSSSNSTNDPCKISNNKSFLASATKASSKVATYSFSTNVNSHNQNSQYHQQKLSSTKATNKTTTSSESGHMMMMAMPIVNRLNDNGNTSNDANGTGNNSISNYDVAIRLQKLTLLFGEVDRAAKRLEQLTEQRRERLRELTRQRTLEDEINEVTSWITSDGQETLQRFANLQMDCEATIKAQEQDFEKYYFISMKHIAKGRDLHDAAEHIDALRESASNLKSALDCFAERLEQIRERIEGASRLHHLLSLHIREENVQQEIQRLAEQIGMTSLFEKYRHQIVPELPSDVLTTKSNFDAGRIKPNSLNLNLSRNVNKQTQNILFNSSTPIQNPNRSSSLNSPFETSLITPTATLLPPTCHCWRESQNLEDMDELLHTGDEEEDGEEEQSKIADSGLGGCDRCEGNPKLTRICSCQSLNETGNIYDKSHNELDDECFEQPTKRYLNIHSPIEANAHLQCHASNFDLPKMEELSGLDPKIQKTLLLIMREMIGTERDYVRSLYYVIENYVDELLRDDIPQPLRGQRNVIFGNIEKIFEFHNSHFLGELERYELSPLKVGAAFLEMESKFYLYALYNKNKPKSDTLMSEYGTTFFKSKQFELNDKMDLASYLLKPVQRMGKYALLLQQLVKACSVADGNMPPEISADVEELQRAEEMVKFQLRHGNDLLAMDSLRDCDVNVKEQGRLLRQNEFLVWQGRGGRKSLRQVFLFEELVLFSKARRFPDHKNLDIYIYKHSIKTSDIGLTAHVGDSTTKFEIWFRKRKPDDTWTLQCMSEDIKHAWTEEISKLLWKQAKRNREIRLAEMSSMGIGSKPCLDIRPSNNQINDRSITISQLGKAPKLRHSFVGLHAEQNKSSRRPNSLISESSISSGTSSSSLSTGSSSGHERSGCISKANNRALELINETQALMLSNHHHHHHHHSGHTNRKHNISPNTSCSNTLSSNSSSIQSTSQSQSHSKASHNTGSSRNHKRSTTLVSQLSMESGIISDISMTPDQEQQPDINSPASSWFASPTTSNEGLTSTFTERRHPKSLAINKNHDIEKQESTVETLEGENTTNPYLKHIDETINL